MIERLIPSIAMIGVCSVTTLALIALIHRFYTSKIASQPSKAIFLTQNLHCAIFASVTFVLAVLAFFDLYSDIESRFDGVSYWSTLLIQIHTSYIINDSCILFCQGLSPENSMDKYGHHTLIMIANIKALYFGIGHFHLACFDLSEITNVFFSYFLSAMQNEWSRTRYFYLAGILFGITFMIFRVAGFGLICLMFEREVSNNTEHYERMHGLDFEFTRQGERMMWFLQLYWFFLYRDVMLKEFYVVPKGN